MVNNRVLDNETYKKAYEGIFDGTITDEELERQGIGKRWVPPTLYSLLCVYKIGLKWKQRLLESESFFRALPPEYIFDDKQYRELDLCLSEKILLVFSHFFPFKPKVTAWFGSTLFRYPMCLVSGIGYIGRLIRTFFSFMSKYWNRSGSADAATVGSKGCKRKISSDAIIALQKECNDFIFSLLFGHTLSEDELIAHFLPQLIVSPSQTTVVLKKDNEMATVETQNNKTLQEIHTFALDEIIVIVQQAVQFESKNKNCIWAYRSGDMMYNKWKRQEMYANQETKKEVLFAGKDYAFSLFSGYYTDSGISPLWRFIKPAILPEYPDNYQSALSMIPISKEELHAKNSFWYIPRVTLFESLVSQGETIHMATKIVYTHENVEKETRGALFGAFEVPYIIADDSDKLNAIETTIDGLSKTIITLHPGRSKEDLTQYIKENLIKNNAIIQSDS